MNDGVCDFRFAICNLAPTARGKPRSRHDRGQFASFLTERIDFCFRHQTAVDNQFHSVRGFVGFLFNVLQKLH